MLLKLVLDTNTLVSGLFWEGNEAELLRKIEQGKAMLYTTRDTLNEAGEVIKRPKFKDVFQKAMLTPDQVMQRITSLSMLLLLRNCQNQFAGTPRMQGHQG
ncbi:putative toxin-antitoxin system toxin component, PIN family [Candidatus Woesearchaeota archaeon]|nr:putative toxin-antitoxin system toxin component, PIN family [Candidatus Woesearchaeota archaeon]